MLHGIYCDPTKEETQRVSALALTQKFAANFSPATKSLLLNQHQRYQSKGEEVRFKASQVFFEHAGLIGLLAESERHALVSNACARLIKVHNSMNNFYNEPPFAERLASLAVGHQIPESARLEFVETVITCSVGNPYGTSEAADIHYTQIISGFSPAEIEVLILLPESSSTVAERISKHKRSKDRYRALVETISPDSVPTSVKSKYDAVLA